MPGKEYFWLDERAVDTAAALLVAAATSTAAQLQLPQQQPLLVT